MKLSHKLKLGTAVILASILLNGCGNNSTDSGVIQGTDTTPFVGTYEGTFELQTIADAIGYDPKTFNVSAPVIVQVTDVGTVHLTLDKSTLDGIIDNNGRWEAEFGVNDFSSLVDQASRKTVRTLGCSLGKQFGKIEGQVTYSDISGEVSGKLTCKVLLVPVGSLEVSGMLTATM